MTNPVGRPRTKLSDLPANWEDLMMTAAQDGASATEIACTLGIARSAWETLLKDSEEFRDAEMRAKMLCQVWWEKQGRRMTQDGVGSAPAWKFNMQNRFAWTERTESDLKSSDGSMSPKGTLDDFYAANNVPAKPES